MEIEVLWHHSLISCLPNKLLEDLAEACLELAGTYDAVTQGNAPWAADIPNWRKIAGTQLDDFYIYGCKVIHELEKRGYNTVVDIQVEFDALLNRIDMPENLEIAVFPEWHNTKYLIQCYYILQYLYDMGKITKGEWKDIEGMWGTICET